MYVDFELGTNRCHMESRNYDLLDGHMLKPSEFSWGQHGDQFTKPDMSKDFAKTSLMSYQDSTGYPPPARVWDLKSLREYCGRPAASCSSSPSQVLFNRHRLERIMRLRYQNKIFRDAAKVYKHKDADAIKNFRLPTGVISSEICGDIAILPQNYLLRMDDDSKWVDLQNFLGVDPNPRLTQPTMMAALHEADHECR